MRKNAFTLIELLAVIVILAIIALIAVPIVLGIINDSKKSSEERSIDLYIDSVSNTITKENLKRKYVPNICKINEEGNINCDGDISNYNLNEELIINIEGIKPSGGTIMFENGKIIGINDLILNDVKYNYDVDRKIKLLPLPTEPGLYDENYKLLASWDELVIDYGLNVESYKPTYAYNGTLYTITQSNEKLSKGILLIISNNVETLNNYIFSNCKNLKSIIIPASVTSIDTSAFKDCSSLSNIKVDDKNLKYEDRNSNAIIEKATNTLILGCKNTIIPSSVTSIGQSAFEGSGLKEISIPNSVTNIESVAFSNCSNLEKIKISNSIVKIGFLTFSGCSSLKSIKIPSSVKSVEWAAFTGCTSLTNVTFDNTNGWYIANANEDTSGINIDVTNTSTNATNLVDTYCGKYWKRN